MELHCMSRTILDRYLLLTISQGERVLDASAAARMHYRRKFSDERAQPLRLRPLIFASTFFVKKKSFVPACSVTTFGLLSITSR